MKKLLPYIFILLILVGTFAPSLVARVQAAPDDLGSCTKILAAGGGMTQTAHNVMEKNCQAPLSFKKYDATYQPPAGSEPGKYVLDGAPPANDTKNEFRDQLDPCLSLLSGTFMGCAQQLTYVLFVSIPSFILGLIAKFFNFSIALTLSSNFYNLPFIETIWKVIRDFSNIFFIIVLLYAAFQTILGLGHGGAKKVIVSVVMMALLVNFSLFFTRVVIDSSNVLALIFYEKIKVVNDPLPELKVSDFRKTGVEEKNIAGALTSGFEINAFFNDINFEIVKAKVDTPTGAVKMGFISALVGSAVKAGAAGATVAGPWGGAAAAILTGLGISAFNGVEVMPFKTALLMISVMITFGIVIYILAYAFFVAALAFFGRVLTLIMLMVVSPFAFVSYAIPTFKKIDTIGFDSWMHKLLESSFVAAVFLFIIYVIAVILQADPFAAVFMGGTEISAVLITLFMPAILIAILLLKATKYTQHASGEFAEKAVSIGKSVAGLAAGVAIGGTIGLAAKGMQAGIGHYGKGLYESKKWTEMEAHGSNSASRFLARRIRSLGGGIDGEGGLAGSSFDLRKGIVGTGLGLVGKASGINLGHDSKIFGEEGGYVADEKRRDANRKKRAEGLKVKEGEEEKQHLNQMKEEGQRITLDNEHEIHEADREIKSAEEKRQVYDKLSSASRRTRDDIKDKDSNEYKAADKEYRENQAKFNEYSKSVAALKQKRSAIKDGLHFSAETGEYNTHNGNISGTQLKIFEAQEKAAEEKRKKAQEDYDTYAGANNGSAEDIALVATSQAELVAATQAEALAQSLASAARATQAFTAAEKAQTAASKDPTNATLATKAAEATTRARTLLNDANTSATNIESFASQEDIEKARNLVTRASSGLGNSQNDYEDTLIPNAEHHLKQVNDRRTWAEAQNIDDQWWAFWNEASRKKSAHEIRMGIRPEKQGGGHGGHSGGSDFLQHLAASAITHAVDGDDKGKKSEASHAQSGGGDHAHGG